jgi:hypothetical protein
MASNWITLRTDNPSLTVSSVSTGNYEVQVIAIDAFGNRSAPINSSQTVNRSNSGAINGENETIESVEDASIVALNSSLALLTWSVPLASGLSVAIRHTPDSSGQWGSANPLSPNYPAASSGQVLIPALTGAYLIRFVNDYGLLSGVTTSLAFTSPLVGSTLLTIDESIGGFAGQKLNCIYDSNLGGLRFNSTYFDDLGLINSLTQPIDTYGAISTEADSFDTLATDGNFDSVTTLIDSYGEDGTIAYYTFSSGYDAQVVSSLELRRLVRSFSRVSVSQWDSRSGLIDDWLYFDEDGSGAGNGEVSIEFRSSTEPLLSASTWTPWTPLVSCVASGRSFQFRAKLIIDDENQDVIATTLGATISKGSTLTVSSNAENVLSTASGQIAGVPTSTSKILFWNSGTQRLEYLNTGTNLLISGSTLNASGGGGGGGGSGSGGRGLWIWGRP